MAKAFIPYQLEHQNPVDLSNDEFPTTLRMWHGNSLYLPHTGTHFVYVYQGETLVENPQINQTYKLTTGMYFSIRGGGYVGKGSGIVITRLGYKGTFMLGGPIESEGRLRYIDNCRDSLLIPPIMRGDPCLNALYFPPGVHQTQHTHPSMRIGMVVSGRGECITPDETIALEPGQVFVIPAGALHSFRTTDSSLTAIAWHPDSSYGPTHEWHPMVISTLVDGVNAPFVKEILTGA